jgi:hypothetical protein
MALWRLFLPLDSIAAPTNVFGFSASVPLSILLDNNIAI